MEWIRQPYVAFTSCLIDGRDGQGSHVWNLHMYQPKCWYCTLLQTRDYVGLCFTFFFKFVLWNTAEGLVRVRKRSCLVTTNTPAVLKYQLSVPQRRLQNEPVCCLVEVVLNSGWQPSTPPHLDKEIRSYTCNMKRDVTCIIEMWMWKLTYPWFVEAHSVDPSNDDKTLYP